MSKSLIDCYLDWQKNQFVRATLPHQIYSTYVSFIDDHVPELHDYFVYNDLPPAKENIYFLIYTGQHDFGGDEYVAVCQSTTTKQVYIFDTESLSFIGNLYYSIPKINKRYNTAIGPPPPELVKKSRDVLEERGGWFSA